MNINGVWRAQPQEFGFICTKCFPIAQFSMLIGMVITAEDGVITGRCAVYTLQRRGHDFFKANSSAKEAVSKVTNFSKRTNKHNIRELFKPPLPRLDCETRWSTTFLTLESMLLVRNLLGHIALTKEFFLLSDIDRFAVQEHTECLEPVYDTTITIQPKKLNTDEFFDEWLKCKVQLQCKNVSNASYLTFAMLHAMKHREITLLSNVVF